MRQAKMCLPIQEEVYTRETILARSATRISLPIRMHIVSHILTASCREAGEIFPEPWWRLPKRAKQMNLGRWRLNLHVPITVQISKAPDVSCASLQRIMA